MTTNQAMLTDLLISLKSLADKSISHGMKHQDCQTGDFQAMFNHIVRARTELREAIQCISHEISKELYSDMEINS